MTTAMASSVLATPGSQHPQPPIQLPKYLPEDMLELPPIDPFAPNLCSYLSRNGRWSFDRHLAALPNHGVGKLHSAIYAAVLAGLSEGRQSEEVHYLVQKTAERNGRPWWTAYREVVAALDGAHRWLSGDDPLTRTIIPARRPGPDYRRIRELVMGDEDTSSLVAASGAIPQTPQEVLQSLYPSEALLCVGRNFLDACTRSIEEWLREDLTKYQFLVPSPMTALSGLTRTGTVSQRCLANSGSLRFIVVEFDFSVGDSTELDEIIREVERSGRLIGDMNAALHAHLQKFLPLTMVVHSGGKSLHGWYPCWSCTQENQQAFMDYARRLGADPRLFTPCQYSRLPWGTRDSLATQSVVYFNPALL